MKAYLTLPNVLTLSRFFLLPFFIVGFYINSKAGMLMSFCVFVVCCITDYLDGYYARSMKQVSRLGQMLDPLADKVLISIAIVSIFGFELASRYSVVPATIILCREIAISGVRDASEESGSCVKTSLLSKWKTATQMISLSLIFLAPIIDCIHIRYIGELLFWLSATLAVISGLKYCQKHIDI